MVLPGSRTRAIAPVSTEGEFVSQPFFKALSRRASLKALGTVGLTAAFASPITSNAKKNHGKHKGKKEDVNKLCKKQAEAWTTLVTTECADPAGCPDELACATPLKGCDFGGFLACFTAAGQAMARSTAPGTVRVAGPLGHAATDQKRSS